MAVEMVVESSLSRLMSMLSRFFNPTEEAKIPAGDGTSVTVVTTHTGRTTLNTEELYKSKPVQDFIHRVVPAAPRKNTK